MRQMKTWRSCGAPYEAFNTGDIGTLTKSSTRASCGTSGAELDGQRLPRPRGDLGLLRPAGTGDRGTFRAELEHVLTDDDDRVVGIQRSKAERNGNHLDVGNCIVFQFTDGRVTDGREHFHDLYAWDEFWS